MPTVPQSVRIALERPAEAGRRHAQIKRLVCVMAAHRMSAAEMFTVLRPKYSLDLPDYEIRSLAHWASQKPFSRPKACSTGIFPQERPPQYQLKTEGLETAEQQKKRHEANAVKFLNGFRACDADFYHASPYTPPENWRCDAEMLLATLYNAGELINLISPFAKCVALSRDEWLKRVRRRELPWCPAGTWIGMNPSNGKGRSDADVTSFRFALLESDALPLDLQFSLLAKLPLPIVAVVDSAGKSLHAWLRIAAPTAEIYRRRLKRDVFAFVEPFGFDVVNSNPARLARFPGVERIEKSRRTCNQQRLLYCAPGFAAFKPIIL